MDLGSLLSTFAVLCTQQGCSRVLPHTSPSAFQKPSAPSAMASSGATSRPRRSASHVLQIVCIADGSQRVAAATAMRPSDRHSLFRTSSGQQTIQSGPHAVDPTADANNRRKDGRNQKTNKHGVLEQGSAVLVLRKPADQILRAEHGTRPLFKTARLPREESRLKPYYATPF